MARFLTRAFDVALRAYPAPFRSRFAAQMRQVFLDAVQTRRISAGRWSAAFYALRAIVATLTSGVAERRFERRRHPAAATRRGLADVVAQDARFAWRVMVRRPGVTALSVMTLAIGIGAATAIFSLLDATLLRPLPFDRPDQLVSVAETLDGRVGAVALDNVVDWKRQSRTLLALTPFQAQSVNLTGVAEPDRLRGGFVTSDFFVAVATPVERGRPFVAGDDPRGAPPVAVLNYQAWQRQFGADVSLVGRVITLNNVPVTVVGIMPERFRFPIDDVDVWLPIGQFTGSVGRTAHNLQAFGRMRSGVSIGQAQGDLDAVAASLARDYPATNGGRGARVVALQAQLTDGIDEPIVLVFILVLVLLAAACANVTSLQLGATLARRDEFSVRAALGAGGGRIGSQLLTEHLLVAFAGGVCGVVIADVLVPLAVHAAPLQVFGLERVRVDGRTLMFAGTTTVAAGLAGGLISAWQWVRGVPGAALGRGARIAGDRRLSRMRGLLVSAQVALAVILLVSSGLLVRTYVGLARVDPGFNPDNVLTLEYRLPRNKYPTPEQQERFHEDVARRVQALPGVRAAALVRALPLSGNGDTALCLTDFSAPESSAHSVSVNTITTGYFETLGIPLVDGRRFDDRDRAGAPAVVMVSRSFAARAWPGASAIGHEVRFVGLDIHPLVIGVVGDVRHDSLSGDRLETVYVHSPQSPGIFMTLVARVEGDAMQFADSVRQAVWQVDSDQPMWKIRTLESLVDKSIGLERFLLSVLAIFATAALLLATTGLYGVVAQSVTQRRREIGVRMALGATRTVVVRSVVATGIRMSVLGVAAGLAAAAGVAQLMTGLLFRVAAVDPAIYVTVTVLLMVVTLAACYVPALRAAGADAAESLRQG